MTNTNNLNKSLKSEKGAITNIFTDFEIAFSDYEIDLHDGNDTEESLHEMLYHIEQMQQFCNNLMNLATKAKTEIEETLG